jgi:hypothetical protein
VWLVGYTCGRTVGVTWDEVPWKYFVRLRRTVTKGAIHGECLHQCMQIIQVGRLRTYGVVTSEHLWHCAKVVRVVDFRLLLRTGCQMHVLDGRIPVRSSALLTATIYHPGPVHTYGVSVLRTHL